MYVISPTPVQVRNKLDRRVYAVKKIAMRVDATRIRREVTTVRCAEPSLV